MHGWTDVITERCAECAVYTPVEELRWEGGVRLCASCELKVPADWEPAATCSFTAPWAAATNPRLVQHTRRTVAVLLVLAACFPLAAWVSQL